MNHEDQQLLKRLSQAIESRDPTLMNEVCKTLCDRFKGPCIANVRKNGYERKGIDPEDVWQQTLLGVYRNPERLLAADNLNAFLLSIAKRRAADAWKTLNRRTKVEEKLIANAGNSGPEAHRTGPESEIDLKPLSAAESRIYDAEFAKLSDVERERIGLIARGMSYDQITNLTNAMPNEIKNLLTRFKYRCRAQLDTIIESSTGIRQASDERTKTSGSAERSAPSREKTGGADLSNT